MDRPCERQGEQVKELFGRNLRFFPSATPGSRQRVAKHRVCSRQHSAKHGFRPPFKITSSVSAARTNPLCGHQTEKELQLVFDFFEDLASAFASALFLRAADLAFDSGMVFTDFAFGAARPDSANLEHKGLHPPIVLVGSSFKESRESHWARNAKPIEIHLSLPLHAAIDAQGLQGPESSEEMKEPLG